MGCGYGFRKFFDKVNHDILMYKLSKDIHDKRVLKLIRKYLQSGIMINGVVVTNEEGTPQGGPLSPLLSNIMLDELDKELEKRGHKFCRYADDCNIYVKSKRAGERVMNNITNFIESGLSTLFNTFFIRSYLQVYTQLESYSLKNYECVYYYTIIHNFLILT